MLGVIQARLGSTRLPGKVLMEIKDKPLLQYCIERVKLACDQTLVLVPAKDFREIWRACSSKDVEIKGIPGDENDVLTRFLVGIPRLPEIQIIRICADSPLIDPSVIKLVAGQSLGRRMIISNTRPKTWPSGQCVETWQSAAMHQINYSLLEDGDMEHVTPFMYRRWDVGYIMNHLGNFSTVNMCVDTQEDFDRIEDVIGRMTRPHVEYGWYEIMEMMS